MLKIKFAPPKIYTVSVDVADGVHVIEICLACVIIHASGTLLPHKKSISAANKVAGEQIEAVDFPKILLFYNRILLQIT